jgi:4-hydroxybenzoate polyprenyltransferase
LLVFVPIVMAHDINQMPKLLHVLAAFASFSPCASGVYVLNDSFDLEADRLHPEKKLRPFASGDVPVLAGLSLLPLLFFAGFAIAARYCPIRFLEIIVIYSAATTLYSIYGERIPIVDILLLTTLYLLRILGGGVAAGVPVSPWLLAFSMFFLLSLAFSKRHAKLTNQSLSGSEQPMISKRDYPISDKDLVQQFGVTNGYLSVLVLALYVNGREARRCTAIRNGFGWRAQCCCSGFRACGSWPIAGNCTRIRWSWPRWIRSVMLLGACCSSSFSRLPSANPL